MNQLTLAACFLALFVRAAGAEEGQDNNTKIIQADNIGRGVVIMGRLGKPIGTSILVKGKVAENGPINNWLWVTEIDGSKINHTIGIQLDATKSKIGETILIWGVEKIIIGQDINPLISSDGDRDAGGGEMRQYAHVILVPLPEIPTNGINQE